MPGRENPSKELRERLNASVVRVTALAIALAAGAMAVTLLIVGPVHGSVPGVRSTRIAVGAVLCVVALICYVMTRRGLVQPAARLLGAVLFVMLMVVPIALGFGVHSAGLPLLAAVIMFAGFLISPAAALAVVVLSIAVVLGLFWAEMAGILAVPTPARLPAAAALTGSYVILFSIAGWLTVRYAGLFAGTITELEEALEAQRMGEAELRAAKEAAEAANVAKNRFLATMSHEIRTPINGVLGMAQLLRMPDLSEAEREEYARTIIDSGRTLLTILNDILDLSKIEAGKLDLELASFDPRQLLDGTARLFRESARSKGLALDVAWQGPQEQYQSDPDRLRQMLFNLISNAVKFTQRGGVRVAAAELERVDGAALLEFSVADSGIGIPAEKRLQLFKPFSQVDSSSTREHCGAGLGLFIVRSLAGLMGGEVGVDSEPGKGSRFWFRVRVPVVSEAGARERRPSTGELPLDLPKFTGSILVVEDNATNLKLMEALLRKLGVGFESAGNGRDAVEAIMRGPQPALVLMDMQLPVMDGIEATERIRRWERETGRARVPIAALTAAAFEEDRQHCLAAGMDDFLAKPIRFEDLIAVLSRWMSTAQEEPAAVSTPT